MMFFAVLYMSQYPAGGHDIRTSVDWRDIGVDEKPGKKIHGDAVFLDEHGNSMTIGSYIDRPTLVLPIYYYCKESCAIMLGNLAAALNEVPLKPGEDFRVISLSIDPEDDQASALQSKKNYFKIIKRDFPEYNWKFMYSSQANIRRLTDSMGYHYKKVGWHNFVHPNVMIVISRDGTIIRYLYGPLFLPFDIGMALTEASKGTPSISIRKLLSYCFSYEPETRTYAFNAVRIIVLGIVATIGVILFFLLRKRNS
jgi:protein SCO1/2